MPPSRPPAYRVRSDTPARSESPARSASRTGAPRRIRSPDARAAAILVLFTATGCAGSAAGGGDAWSDAEWRTIHEPRPEPLPGAATVTVAEVSFLDEPAWPATAPVAAELGVAELVTANLLRRRDVHFVERRRFAAAAAAERRGLPRPPGRPPAGVSPGADLGIGATWIPVSAAGAAVEVRLVELESGEVPVATRLEVSRSVDPVTLARAVVAEALGLLDELERRPSWSDPLGGVANVGEASGVSDEALVHFLRGLDAEETWRWEEARRGYQQALSVDPDFYEARVALRRTARLRLGGTLGES